MTSQKISKNEKILYIPDKLSISQIHKLVFKKCLEAYGPEDGNDFNCLAYFMTIDNYNSSSQFKPYYDYLPLINNSDFIFDFTSKHETFSLFSRPKVLSPPIPLFNVINSGSFSFNSDVTLLIAASLVN